MSERTGFFKPRKLLDTDIYYRDNIFDELRCCPLDKLRLASVEIYRLYFCSTITKPVNEDELGTGK